MSQVEHAALIGDGFLGAPLRMRFQPRPQDVGPWPGTGSAPASVSCPPSTRHAAEAVFAEVAANAVRHGRGRVTVTVEFLGTARCAAPSGTAAGTSPSSTTGWRPDLEDGRGMVIIEALADGWGVRRHLLGKTVWFEIRVPARPRCSPPRPGRAQRRPDAPARTAPRPDQRGLREDGVTAPLTAGRGRGHPLASGPMRITSRGARFQEWTALLGNRAKRQRRGEFMVQGVRPITLAVRARLAGPGTAVQRGRRAVPVGARDAAAAAAAAVAVSADLMAELGGKDEGAPELLAVVALPRDELSRIPAGPGLLAVVFDRPSSPGNIGTLIRSADAFGASGVIITGHAADVYDPRSVRASTGSLFALPVVRAAVAPAGPGLGARPARRRDPGRGRRRRRERRARRLRTSTSPARTLLLIGNETTGLTAGWREACDELARIPMLGAASSLNAATAASVLLYESARQRIAARRA